MTKLSDLPNDLAEEVLLRLPVTSLRGARSTCKKWNTLTKDESFTKLHLREAAAKKKQRTESQVVMMLEYKVYLMSVDLLNPSIEGIGKVVSLGDGADRVDISKISHCDGLFLCITNDDDDNSSRLVVWNPYNGQTRWIEPRNSYHEMDRYALGYEKKENNSLRSHKVLRFMDNYYWRVKHRFCEFEIYSLNSDSWKVVHLTPGWHIASYQRGVSLKGNTYWFARAINRLGYVGPTNEFLLCFDFTNERFGPRLPLPFRSCPRDTVALSSVRENQLAVLFQRWNTLKMKIWISDRIEHDAVSWRKCFLAVDMRPLTGFQFQGNAASFLVDEKKNVAVVLDKDNNIYCPTRNVAYIIGKEGYFETVDLGGSTNADCSPLVCSYVPSSVQIKQAVP